MCNGVFFLSLPDAEDWHALPANVRVLGWLLLFLIVFLGLFYSAAVVYAHTNHTTHSRHTHTRTTSAQANAKLYTTHCVFLILNTGC